MEKRNNIDNSNINAKSRKKGNERERKTRYLKGKKSCHCVLMTKKDQIRCEPQNSALTLELTNEEYTKEKKQNKCEILVSNYGLYVTFYR